MFSTCSGQHVIMLTTCLHVFVQLSLTILLFLLISKSLYGVYWLQRTTKCLSSWPVLLTSLLWCILTDYITRVLRSKLYTSHPITLSTYSYYTQMSTSVQSTTEDVAILVKIC